jgi:lipopolysaccharide export system protein LptA
MLRKAENIAEFTGTAAAPATLWQGASQVQAAQIVADRTRRTLVATPAQGGMVHSVFAEEKPAKMGSSAAKGSASRVTSARLEYSDADRRAVLAGPVTLENSTATVRGDHAELFFAAAAAKKEAPKTEAAKPPASLLGSGSLERAVITGAVQLLSPGRSGRGEQMVYTAAESSFLLTGTAAAPPVVEDARQGTVTGGSLLFRTGAGGSASAGDSTIVVASAPPAASGAARQRARIETRVRQKAP